MPLWPFGVRKSGVKTQSVLIDFPVPEAISRQTDGTNRMPAHPGRDVEDLQPDGGDLWQTFAQEQLPAKPLSTIEPGFEAQPSGTNLPSQASTTTAQMFAPSLPDNPNPPSTEITDLSALPWEHCLTVSDSEAEQRPSAPLHQETSPLPLKDDHLPTPNSTLWSEAADPFVEAAPVEELSQRVLELDMDWSHLGASDLLACVDNHTLCDDAQEVGVDPFIEPETLYEANPLNIAVPPFDAANDTVYGFPSEIGTAAKAESLMAEGPATEDDADKSVNNPMDDAVTKITLPAQHVDTVETSGHKTHRGTDGAESLPWVATLSAPDALLENDNPVTPQVIKDALSRTFSLEAWPLLPAVSSPPSLTETDPVNEDTCRDADLQEDILPAMLVSLLTHPDPVGPAMEPAALQEGAVLSVVAEPDDTDEPVFILPMEASDVSASPLKSDPAASWPALAATPQGLRLNYHLTYAQQLQQWQQAFVRQQTAHTGRQLNRLVNRYFSQAAPAN